MLSKNYNHPEPTLENDPQSRVLVLAPTTKDAQVTQSLLCRAGVHCVVCPTLRDLAAQAAVGAGALLLTEDAVRTDEVDTLLDVLSGQPTWSDLPVVLLMRGGVESPVATRVLDSLANATLLERPAPMRSVVSAVQAAVRARKRQYEIRDQLETIRHAEAELRRKADDLHKADQERQHLLASERAARAEAERAGRMKDEFLATLSHELRTPLNAILGWAQVLRRLADDPEEVKNGMEIIERNARVQGQLIEDLLDMSRIISGKVRLEVQSTDPANIIDAAIESVGPAAEAREVRIQKRIGRSSPVLGDPNRLQQILWNLLSNAVKFTPKGGSVTVSLDRVASNVEIAVADTGVGIAAEFLPHVFERFRQADASTTRKHGGLGLGLAICQQLAELHGGSVRAESPGEGKGATFTLSLPISAILQPTEQMLKPARGEALSPKVDCRQTDLTGVKVLVIDDDADARGLVYRLLTDCKAQVTTASSAVEALRLLAASRPDIVISDIGMPEMDGYQFIEKVRATYASREEIPAIALTAFARPEDRRRALAAGYQSHLSKPVEPAELLAMVADLARGTEAPL
jgi:signal transduction histidine kinase/CheY-like chemotaxis protein